MAPQNQILAALSPQIYEELAPFLRQVSLEQGKRLHDPGEPIEAVYFPIDCACSITLTMSDGITTVETAIVGYRDMLGVNVLMAKQVTTRTTYLVQIPGDAFKLDAQTLRQLCERYPELRDQLLNYTQAFIAQLSQNVACNRAHTLDQRFARWLLEAQDRVKSNEFRLTQDFIAEMLGVRRAGVTVAANKYQDLGLISYRRGVIEIRDQQRLEAMSCECFKAIKAEYDRLLGAG
ncbi:Crp/Fnr family transcriptional regulator [Phormidesmis sp. 146-12]